MLRQKLEIVSSRKLRRTMETTCDTKMKKFDISEVLRGTEEKKSILEELEIFEYILKRTPNVD